MKSVLASVASVALLAGSVVAQAPMVNTPASSTVCQPLLITWSGGTAPYFLSVLPGNQPSAAPLVDFGQVSGNSLSWTVNVTNPELGINLRDSSGLLSQSAAFPNLPGTNQACLTQAPSPPPGPTSGGSGSSTPPAPPTSAPPTSAPPVSTPVSTPPASPTSKPPTSATPTSATPSGSPKPSTTGAATSLSAKAGIAGALGLAIAALFA
ncbi:hypothetical protein BJ165DRAFT_1461866 [Panaeolus papilionaceus]|nr:hypothetical protein BJ165DRAFT_1461866 [Panaeolus papilionaceus]